MDSLFTVLDDKFDVPTPPGAWSTIDTIYSVKDYVNFELNNDLHWLSGSSFTCAIDLEITRWDANGDSLKVYPTLLIDYNPASGAVYKNKATYVFYGAHKFKVKILLVNLSPYSSSVANLFKLSGTMEIERNYDFDCSAPSAVTKSYISADNELQINWPSVDGATDYDLEYTYYSDSSYEVKNITAYATHDSLYRDNASRINTINTSAVISLIYPKGYLFYRVRAVRQLMDGQRELGEWTTDTSYKYHVAWHQDSLNWQSVITFAEEGKRKQAVSYFDGSLRNRQSVTKLNTDNEVIVGETIYDFQGRPALSVMPVPSNTSKLKYFNKFNLYSSTVTYNRNHFDTSGCGWIPYQMDTTSGAANYYSGGNPVLTSSNKFIPDARGYPFSITEYTQDNTGRIGRKSGVGYDLMLGRGHETKYYYGKPSTAEIDRIFGNDVGYASHYTKEMVMDANSQVSVTYKDAHNRVIATALAGNNPSNLDTISDYPSADSSFTINLIENQMHSPPSLSSSTSFLVSKQGTYSFLYGLVPPYVTIDNCDTVGICYDCLYDITISISDNCGNDFNLVNPGMPFDTSYRNYSLAMFDTSCANDPVIAVDSFSLVLPIGSYTVSKTATISSDAISFYTEKFLEENTCHSLQTFIDSAVAHLDFTGCFMDCEACTTSLGTEADFLHGYITDLIDHDVTPTAHDTSMAAELYLSMRIHCTLLCEENYCRNYFFVLASDVSPGGQYGYYYVDSITGAYSYPDPTSVIGNSAYADTNLLYYKDFSLVEDSVLNSFGVLVPPYLLTRDEFINSWNPFWAYTLVTKHPEYCYFRFCSVNTDGHTYDQSSYSIDNWDEADSLGFLDPLGINANYPDNIDPFFGWDSGTDYNSLMSDTMLHYNIINDSACHDTLSVWDIALISALTRDTSDFLDCGFRVDSDTLCEGEKNMAWTTFRAIYQSLKQYYYTLAETEYANNNGCCNKCIGALKFAHIGFMLTPPDCNDSVTTTCDIGTYYIKTPRFLPSPTEYFQSSFGNQSAANQYLDTNITKHCSEMCHSYAVTWMDKLKACALSSSDSLALLDSLIAVCTYGCDLTHPWGSSTSPPGAPCGPGNCTFQDIIEGYRITYGCDPADFTYLLITFPPPYENSANVGSSPVYDSVPECSCNKLEHVWSWYSTYFSGSTYDDFAQWMDTLFDSQLTGDEINALLEFCDSANTCNFLPHPIKLPDILTCPVCVDCRDINVYYDQFIELNPNIVGTLQFPELLTGFLNNILGFNLSYDDYITLLKNCDIPQEYVLNCDTLAAMLEIYEASDSINSYYPLYLWLNLHFDVLHEKGFYESFYKDNCGINLKEYTSQHLNCSVLQEAYNHYIAHGNVTGDPSFYANLIAYFAANYWLTYSEAAIKDLLETSCPLISINDPPSCYELDSLIQQFVLDTIAHFPIINFPDSLAKWLYYYHFPYSTISVIYDSLVACSLVDTSLFIPSCDELHEALSAYDDLNLSVPLVDYLNWEFHFNYPIESYHHLFKNCFESTLPLRVCNHPICEIVPPDDLNDCVDQLLSSAIANAQHNYELYKDSLKNTFINQYVSHCMQPPLEVFTASSTFKEYHYTLYYYDQGGNLVKTVPPAGVKILNSSQIDSVSNHRSNPADPAIYPAHTLVTKYYYNSLDEITMQNGPDDSTKWFWYDRVGRLVVSQNMKQKAGNYYSYTTYDPLGRIIEVGKIKKDTALTKIISRNADSLLTWLNTNRKYELTHTYYDEPAFAFTGYDQVNLRGRVASVTYEDKFDNDSLTYNSASHYTYDISGNVTSLLQENTSLASIGKQFKKIDYEYDLISGKMNKVFYQPDSTDKFIHKYEYDADNRITDVLTSNDGLNWDHDAFYKYYKHGPLARTILGERQVQGLDYAYTLQGWLKGVNSSWANTAKDMGQDAKPGATNEWIAKDAYGFTLGYFTNEYRAIGGSGSIFEAAYASSGMNGNAPSLYNGNIRYSMLSLPYLSCNQNIAYPYQYDQLNRLVNKTPFSNFDSTNFRWDTGGGTFGSLNFQEKLNYDPNGNITSYTRKGTQCNSLSENMDTLRYNYYSGTNKLHWVDDNAGFTGNYTVDIDDQSSGNYKYDLIGNLIYDFAEKDSIWWNNAGKVDSIRSYGTDSLALKFHYDPAGNRIEKKYYVLKHDTTITTTFYSRDAQGNIMATYEWKDNDTLKIKEIDMYGSSRLGTWNIDTMLYSTGTGNVTYNDTIFQTLDGRKQYELTNHLGNVMTTISDKHIPIDTGSTGVDYYLPEVITQQDYYSFGMLEPERNYSINTNANYRFGFNGKMMDNEIYSGNQYDYGFRVFDARLGRFLSTDPLYKSFPWYTPYQFAGNTPIWANDLEGREPDPKTATFGHSTRTALENASVNLRKLWITQQASNNNKQPSPEPSNAFILNIPKISTAERESTKPSDNLTGLSKSSTVHSNGVAEKAATAVGVFELADKAVGKETKQLSGAFKVGATAAGVFEGLGILGDLSTGASSSSEASFEFSLTVAGAVQPEIAVGRALINLTPIGEEFHTMVKQAEKRHEQKVEVAKRQQEVNAKVQQTPSSRE
jgi:RHS repeat-associated protein